MLRNSPFDKVVYLDFETTGLDYKTNYPIEVAAKSSTGEVYNELIKVPFGIRLRDFIVKYTGITDEMLRADGKVITEIQRELSKIIDDRTLVVAHNAAFDLAYLSEYYEIVPKYFLCTRTAWFLTEPDKSSSLQEIVKCHLGDIKQEHRAKGDVELLEAVANLLVERHKEGMMFFINKMVQTPERELMYVPENAEVLRFT